MNQFEPNFRQPDPALESAIGRANRSSMASRQFDEGDGEAPPFDLRALIGLARRQKWTIIATTILGLGLGFLYVSQVDRQYTATALLVVDTRNSEMLGVAPGLNDTLGVNAVVSTEVEIIRSSSVLARAASALDVPTSPVFDAEPSRWNGILAIFGLDEEQAAAPVAWSSLTEAQRADWVRSFGGHIQVSQRGGTNVISISATTTIPTESAAWANAVAAAYLDEQILSKLLSRETTTRLLRDRVESLGADVRVIEEQLDAFITQAIDQAGTPEARAMLANIRSETSVLDAQQTRLASLRDALQTADATVLAQLIEDQNPTLAVQRQALVQDLAVETDADRAARIRADLAALEDEIRAAAASRAQTLDAEVANRQENIGVLQGALNDTVAQQPLPNNILLDLFELQQNAQTTRGLYSSYLSRLRAAEQEVDFALADSRVIATAVTPNAPSFPSVRSTLMMALLLSGAAGFGLALIRENLIGGIASVDHLEQSTGLPVVAAVPRYKTQKNEEPDWAIIDQPLSAFSEAIRRTRIGIESIDPDNQLRLLVTSAAPGEGKTTTALSLARSFARSGKSTILIDADLRHPSVHKHVKHQVEVGLIDYLLRGRAAETAHLFMMQEEATGLHLVLGSEASSVATDSLILSQRFRSVIEYATKEYEVVIIDSPPVGLVVDPQLIAREYANVVLFVVKAEATAQRVVKAALRDMTMHARTPVVGLLNQVAGKKRYYGKYASYYK